MIKRLILILLLLAGTASAEVATVKGGEHPDFTRIVIEAGSAGDWRFGRTDDGYELALDAAVTGFNLTEAFEKIPRDRVSGLWRDPASGRLRIALSCACHAIAFEFRPGIIVVDVKSGPPPDGSSFELALDPPPAASAPEPEVAEEVPAPDADTASDAPVYNWLELRGEDAGKADLAPVDMSDAVVAAALDPLREALLEQISRGAAEGVVEIAEHPALPDPADTGLAEAEGLRVSLGELPGIVIGGPKDGGRGLASDGTECIADDQLAIADWGLPGPVAEQLGPGRSGLLTEFDAAVPQAVLRAARAYLSLTFGAEARQFLDLLEDPAPPEAAILRAMSHIVDQDALPENPFEGMESCDGAAALWASLAATAAGAEDRLLDMNTDALARSFSALPPHLRRYFAPVLVELLLSRGDEETARILRDAVHRAPGEAGPEIGLMDAGFDLSQGENAAAQEKAEAVLQDAGPLTSTAAITLVEAAFAGGRNVDPDLPDKVDALVHDARGTELEAPLRRAVVLAHAMANDLADAFAALPQAPGTAADLWSIAAGAAADDLFLAEAITAAVSGPQGLPQVAGGTAVQVATRLLDLGFAREGLVWLGPVEVDDPEETRMLAARGLLALRDARAALAMLSGLADPEAEALRAAAVLQLGDPAAAAEAWDRAGDTEAGDRARVWTQDWPMLAETGPEPWMQAAALVTPSADGTDPAGAPAAPAPTEGPPAEDVAENGPLARGADLVAESAAAREAIEGLLLSVATAPVP